MSAAQAQQVRVEWNDTACRCPWEPALHRLFAGQAGRTPEAVAVEIEGGSLTYRELDRRSDRLARRLGALGVGPDTPVGVCAERSLELPVALLAVLKAGGAYLPLDPSYPAERLTDMVRDAGAPVVLVQQGMANRFDPGEARAVPLEEGGGPADGAAAEPPWRPPAVHPDQLAYVIYTSGSTGRPKGAMNTHRAIVNRLWWMQEAYRLGPDDRVLQKTPFSFDVSVWELFWPLVTGARMVLARPDGHRDNAYLVRRIREARITTLHFVPSMLQPFLEEEGVDRLPALARVVCSGEALPAATVRRFFQRCGAELHNLYGPTEAAVDVTAWPCTPLDGERGVPIGRPISNLGVWVVDEHGAVAPPGVPGELMIGGAGLARGYLGRPALTAERFVPDGLGGERGARLYRTGDLTRHRSDGAVDFLGRLDHQVKVRGFRIELGEIEAALADLPEVAESAVLARDDLPGGTRIVAYAVLRDGRQGAVEELRAALSRRLPDHMLPGLFVFLDALPLTPNGKLDRRALPLPELDRSGLAAGFVAPRTRTEEVLAAIWSEVLGVERVGVHDGFFALGGDSILTIRVIALAEARGLELSVPLLFRHQTVAELAARLASTGGESAEGLEAHPPFAWLAAEDRERLPAGLDDAYPLTQLQSGMLYHLELTPDAPLYHNVNSIHLRAPFAAAAFRAAVAAVISRHPVLRTGFALTGYSEPLQLVWPEVEPAVSVSDLSGLGAAEQEAEIGRFVAAEVHRPFDLARPPLLRFHVHLRDAATFQLTLVENHAISDGWSLHLNLAEVFEHFLALLDGERPPVSGGPELRFADYVALERKAVGSQASRTYWREQLAGAAPLELPRWPVPAGRRPGGLPVGNLDVAVRGDTFSRLRDLARRQAVPLKSVLLAAHLKVLSTITGRRDLVTGLTVHGRPEVAGGDRMRGLFLNTLPFRMRLAGGSWSELVAAAFAAERELLPHRRYPMAAIEEEMGFGRPLFEVSFTFVDFHAVGSLLRSRRIEVLGFRRSEATNFPLAILFQMAQTGDGFTLQIEHDPERVPAERARAIAGYYLATLDALAAAPEAAHGSFSALPAAERHRLLADWNPAAGRTLQWPPTLDGMVRRQTALSPEEAAVSWEGGSWSYGELAARASGVAARLRRAGVRRGDRVGVCVARSPEMVAALLGVLEAGAAWVPLDPGYPVERLRRMQQDASPSALLVAQAGLPAGLEAGGVPLVDASGAEAEAPQAAAPETGGDDLAYVLYTSGSTGRPKGVMVPHRAIVNHTAWMAEGLVGPTDRVLVKTPLAYDASIWEVFQPLVVGATAVLARPDGEREPAYLVEAIRRHRITVVQFVPSVLELVLEEEGVAQCSTLRRVFAGGEPLTPRLRRLFASRCGAELVNLYGPTEAAIDATWERAGAADDDGWRGGTPIGRPLPEVRAFVLGDGGDLVAPGSPGELYLAGASLARGYHRDPRRTAERFVPDPLSARPGDRLYRTGDRVRHDGDGTLVYLGRLDGQMKVAGVRLEAGEIEALLQQHPAVRQAAAAAVPFGPAVAGGTPTLRPVAWVVPVDLAVPADELEKDLRAHLERSLPPASVPARILRLEAMPLGPAGKLDRASLPRPVLETEGPGGATAPRSAVAELLAGLWMEVLGIREVPDGTSFFALGGHSLSAMRLASRIRRTFGVDVPLVRVFEAADLHRMSEAVDEALRADEGTAAPPVRPVERRSRRPSPVLRPGTALVPRAAHRRARPVRHPGVGPAARAARRRRRGRGAGRGRAAPRDPAHADRRGGRPADASAGPAGPVAASMPRPGVAAGASPGDGGAAPGHPRRPASVRPRPRVAAASRAGRPGRGGSRAGPRGLPPGERLLVDAGPGARARRALPRRRRSRAGQPRPPAGAVRGLCGLAARPHERRRAGAGGRLVAAAPGRRAAPPRARPAALPRRRALVPRELRDAAPSRRAGRRVAGALPGRGGHRLHGGPGRLRGRAPPPLRGHRPGHRHRRGQPGPAGDRGADRALRQPAPAACRPVGRPGLPRAPRPQPAGGPGRLCTPGPALRPPGPGDPARAQPRPRAAVPGQVPPRGRGARKPDRVRGACPRVLRGVHRPRRARPDLQPRRHRGGPRWNPRLQHRPVRRRRGPGVAGRLPERPRARDRGPGNASVADRRGSRRSRTGPSSPSRRRAARGSLQSPSNHPQAGNRGHLMIDTINTELVGYRISPQQRRLWTLGAGDPSSPLRIQGLVEIGGPIDAEALEKAWREVLSRHEILRTGFRCPSSMTQPVQVIEAPPADPAAPLEVDDLGELPAAAARGRLDDLISADREPPDRSVAAAAGHRPPGPARCGALRPAGDGLRPGRRPGHPGAARRGAPGQLRGRARRRDGTAPVRRHLGGAERPDRRRGDA